MPYNELLDYVYFETEPMRSAVKGQMLDFSTVQKPHRFVDPVGLLPLKVFYELRKKFEQLDVSEPVAPSTEGVEDAELLRLLSSLDEDGPYIATEGEVLIDDKTKSDLRAEFRS